MEELKRKITELEDKAKELQENLDQTASLVRDLIHHGLEGPSKDDYLRGLLERTDKLLAALHRE
jgi:predicted alpha/beta-fold hydrolase